MLVSVTIIPNEKKLNLPFYYQESEIKNHHEIAVEFCVSAGIEFDIKNAYKSLLEYGCVVTITQASDSVCTWLPKELSEKQYQKLLELKSYFSQFDYQEYSSWFDNDLYIYPNKDLPKQKVLEEFYKRIEDCYRMNKSRKRLKGE